MVTPSESLQLTQIQKAFDEDVLDGINLTVESGEFIVLVGPNGCGKTTLLRIIAGLLGSDSGTIQRAQGNGQEGLSVVFQKSLLLPWLTVEENICLPLRLKDVKRPPQGSLEDLLDILGLQNKIKSYPKNLSGGEAQKVAIARALVTNPGILLMDEPFSALDDTMRHTLQELLLRIHREMFNTILLVTHDLDEAVLLGDRIVVFSPKPSQVKTEIAIKLNHPRDRGSPEFENFVLNVRRALLP